MRFSTLVLPLAVLLAGCGDDKVVAAENASVEEVQQKLKEAGRDEQFVRPGRWEQRATLVDIDVPGMPPDMRAGMKKAMGTSQTHVTCLTPDQAKNPREEFFVGADKSCRYESFRWGGGQIDVRMRCGGQDRQQTMALNGTYSPDTYQMNMAVHGQGPRPDQQMTMSMRVEARRVGECTGQETG